MFWGKEAKRIQAATLELTVRLDREYRVHAGHKSPPGLAGFLVKSSWNSAPLKPIGHVEQYLGPVACAAEALKFGYDNLRISSQEHKTISRALLTLMHELKELEKDIKITDLDYLIIEEVVRLTTNNHSKLVSSAYEQIT